MISDFRNSRVHYVKFLENGGCASPVRNIGLDIVHLTKRHSTNWYRPFVLVVDSDDRLFDEYSLHELLKIAGAEVYKKEDIALVHGYSATEIHEDGAPVVYVPNPRDFDSTFYFALWW